MLEQYRAQLADARHEAARLREQAKEEAAQIVAQGRADGAAERERIIASASAQIEADRQQALTALRAEVGTPGGRAGQPDRRRVAGRRGQAVAGWSTGSSAELDQEAAPAGQRSDERREQGLAQRGQGAAVGRAGRRARPRRPTEIGDAAVRRRRPARPRARAAPQPVRPVEGPRGQRPAWRRRCSAGKISDAALDQVTEPGRGQVVGARRPGRRGRAARACLAVAEAADKRGQAGRARGRAVQVRPDRRQGNPDLRAALSNQFVPAERARRPWSSELVAGKVSDPALRLITQAAAHPRGRSLDAGLEAYAEPRGGAARSASSPRCTSRCR